jgi:hypothetical protein
MTLNCLTDPRRDAVRQSPGRHGLDYVEVGGEDAPNTLVATFLGKLPPELATDGAALLQYLQITGGERITGLRILDVDPQVQADPEKDDFLVITLDRAGDRSPYTLRLVGLDDVDPRYASASFAFGLCCPSDLDCAPGCGCEPVPPDEPTINYLAKDFETFRDLIYDRLSLLMPDWTERHTPDLGVTLVELLAYAGDQLSDYQDAVGTEAYLGTARQRISVRRHARLVDYVLHEGCNARAWVHVNVSSDLDLPGDRIAFTTRDPINLAAPTMIAIEDLDRSPSPPGPFFEPLFDGPAPTYHLLKAHDAISFYTWGRRECCLDAGSTCATLRDTWVAPASTVDGKAPAASSTSGGDPYPRALQLHPGDVLVFEEVLGARTGNPADADPTHRWAVRLTRVTPAVDTLYPVTVGDGDAATQQPTPLVEIEWAVADAPPFALCLSTIASPPGCAYLADVTIARGNIVPVDHGRTQPDEPLPAVPGAASTFCCECEGEPSDVRLSPARYRPTLANAPVVHRQPAPTSTQPAATSLAQDPRLAVPDLALTDDSGFAWTVKADLIASGPDDRDVVLETDNLGIAHLRFGDDELGRAPEVGAIFTARYRVGGGVAGNVGAEAIARLVLKGESVSGVTLAVRNPLPALGGIDPEPIDDARLFAPGAFRHVRERAVTAADYAEIAARDPALQGASARLAWSGSWYEADVAIDPLGAESATPALIDEVACRLWPARRLGHDLRVQAAAYVPLSLGLSVCAKPGYDRGHVKAALLTRFGRAAATPTRPAGFFNADQLRFGEGVRLSHIVAAAQAVPGVECVTVTVFHRQFAPPNHEIENGLLPLAPNEIAQLDNDPNHPERGVLAITVAGGR